MPYRAGGWGNISPFANPLLSALLLPRKYWALAWKIRLHAGNLERKVPSSLCGENMGLRESRIPSAPFTSLISEIKSNNLSTTPILAQYSTQSQRPLFSSVIQLQPSFSWLSILCEDFSTIPWLTTIMRQGRHDLQEFNSSLIRRYLEWSRWNLK